MTPSTQQHHAGAGSPHNDPWWRARSFAPFLTSRLISQTGDMAATAALTIHVYASTRSATAVGGLYAVRTIPRIAMLVAGGVGDRHELRRLLILCDLISGVIYAAVAAAAPGYGLLLALTFLAECAATLTLPASRTVVPKTVDPGHRTQANALLLGAIALGFSLGSALGGLAATTVGYRWALLANAASFVVSVALLARLPRISPESRDDQHSYWQDTRDGIAALRGDRQARGVVVGLLGVAFASSLDRPALVLLVRQDLHASGIFYGLAMAGVAFGAITATIGSARTSLVNDRTRTAFAVGITFQAAGHLTMGVSPAVLLLLLGSIAAGLGNGLENICGNTLLQRHTDARSLGLVMGLVLGGSYVANAAGSLLGGVAVELTTPRATFVIAALIIAVSSLPSLLNVAGRSDDTLGDPPSAA